jgi:hypothetical protein
MKRSISLFAAMMLVAPAALAYQVTGPVLEVTDTKIVVEKDKEKWEIARDKDTKVTGGPLKKGAKVTVQYKMTATSIENRDGEKKDAKGSKDTKAADKASDKAAVKK